jgi:hypothetical protein
MINRRNYMQTDKKAGTHKKETKPQTNMHRLQTLTQDTYYIALRLSKQFLETVRENNPHTKYNA